MYLYNPSSVFYVSLRSQDLLSAGHAVKTSNGRRYPYRSNSFRCEGEAALLQALSKCPKSLLYLWAQPPYTCMSTLIFAVAVQAPQTFSGFRYRSFSQTNWLGTLNLKVYLLFQMQGLNRRCCYRPWLFCDMLRTAESFVATSALGDPVNLVRHRSDV